MINAKHTPESLQRCIEFLEFRSKRSNYYWSHGATYTQEDVESEGSIECAQKALKILYGEKSNA